MKLTEEQKKERREAREKEKQLLKVEAEKQQKPVKKLTISIEWKKSRTWGHNPHAIAEVEFLDGTFRRQEGFTCSGCGYDKESTVVAQVFNAFLKYKLWERKSKSEKPYGITIQEDDGKHYTPYCYYGDGIGMRSYESIAEFIGGKLDHTASGKSFEVWQYVNNSNI